MALYKVNVVETQGYTLFVIADSHEAAKQTVNTAVKTMTCADMVANMESFNEDSVTELGIESIDYLHENIQVLGSELIMEEVKADDKM